MATNTRLHFYLISFPGQGHINPLLRLAKRLASAGHIVTFSTTEGSARMIRTANDAIDNQNLFLVGDGIIRFEFFDDGFLDDDPRRFDLCSFMTQLEQVGKDMIPRIVRKHQEQGCPISCFINNPFIPWVSDVSDSLGIPSAILWVQSCACFSAYYHYYHKLVPFPSDTQPKIDVQLPSMPVLKFDEIPSFLLPDTPYAMLREAILGQYKNLSKALCIFMETFQELEDDAIKYMSNLCPIKPVGPLLRIIPDSKALDSDIRADFFKVEDCIEWLDSKPTSSVVYVSFGSVVTLSQEQINEIAYGLLSSEVNFLWVMKPAIKERNTSVNLPNGFLEEAGERGLVVQWSPQEQVLAHSSVACFMTHCGWNSSMEALCYGVPVLAFPQWGDQVTNAKFLVDEFKVGIRMCKGEVENRIIPRDEIAKGFLEATSGEIAAEMKENALKWKTAAEKAGEEGGAFDRHLQAFVEQVMEKAAKPVVEG